MQAIRRLYDAERSRKKEQDRRDRARQERHSKADAQEWMSRSHSKTDTQEWTSRRASPTCIQEWTSSRTNSTWSASHTPLFLYRATYKSNKTFNHEYLTIFSPDVFHVGGGFSFFCGSSRFASALALFAAESAPPAFAFAFAVALALCGVDVVVPFSRSTTLNEVALDGPGSVLDLLNWNPVTNRLMTGVVVA